MTLKTICLILSIVVILFIFYKHYDFGHQQLQNFESFSNNAIESVNKGEEKDAGITCSADFSKSLDLPLKEYCVKSSFNSAYDGSDVSKETILKRIKEGYRFLDLNVFSASGDVYVGFSPDNSPTLISNKLLLSDALQCINDNAFGSTTTFNSKLSKVETYPMFVHMRIYRTPSAIVDIISEIQTVINGSEKSVPPAYTSNYLRDSDKSPIKINGCTLLSNLMGKLIFSMDILNLLEIYAPRNYQSAITLPPKTITSMQSFVNVLTGGSTFPAFYRYTEDSLIYRTNTLSIGDSSMKGSLQTNVKYMYISFPHPDDLPKTQNIKFTGVVQPDTTSFILSRSIQFTPLRVYLADPHLNTYINIFDNIGTPFAPMFYVYRHLMKKTSVDSE